MSLRETDPIFKRGLLLTYVGETTNDIFDTLLSTGTDYAAAVESLTERFDPSTNKDMEIYEFRQITQESGETINEFYRRLKEKSSSCEFTNAEAEIRTQIMHKTSDNRLRLPFKSITDGTLEQSDRHSKLLEEDHKTLRQTNFIGGKKTQERQRRYTAKDTKTRYNAQVKQSTQKCRNCGGFYPHIGGKSSCPAARKKCFQCGNILVHFGKYCMSKQRQPTGPSHQHNHQQQERHRYQNKEQKRHNRREVRGLSEQQPSDTDEEFICTIIPSKKTPKYQSK